MARRAAWKRAVFCAWPSICPYPNPVPGKEGWASFGGPCASWPFGEARKPFLLGLPPGSTRGSGRAPGRGCHIDHQRQFGKGLDTQWKKGTGGRGLVMRHYPDIPHPSPHAYGNPTQPTGLRPGPGGQRAGQNPVGTDRGPPGRPQTRGKGLHRDGPQGRPLERPGLRRRPPLPLRPLLPGQAHRAPPGSRRHPRPPQRRPRGPDAGHPGHRGVPGGGQGGDATSFHVHGRYEGLGEAVGAIRVTHGYSRENRRTLEGFSWILRVSATLKEARAQEEEGGLRRRVARAQGEAEKTLGKLLSRGFAREADARRALEEASGRLPHHRPVYPGVQEERRRGRVGRPGKGEAPLPVGCRLPARRGSWSGRGGARDASSWPRTSRTGRPCRPGRCRSGTGTGPGRWSGASAFSKTPCSSPQAPS